MTIIYHREYCAILEAHSIMTRYYTHEDFDKLKNNYVKALKTMPRFWTDNGFYIEMLWLLSIGIMLDYEDDLIHGLVQLIKDREAIFMIH